MVAIPNFFRSIGNRLRGDNTASNIVPIRNTAIPIKQDGAKLSPHEFLERQITGLPDEEESMQKRALFAIAYFLATWGGSVIMVLLGFGLANDLQTVFHITGSYGAALSILFPFAEFIFEMLAILVGERISQGLKSGSDIAFVLVFGLFVILSNVGTAMLQVFLFGWHNATESSIASLVLWFRAFLPLLTVVGTIGVVSGIQRRSLSRMINALDRKALALTRVAEAAVRYLEAQMNAQRAMDEHQDARNERDRKDRAFNELQAMMRASFERDMDEIRKLREKPLDNGRNGRL